MHTILAIDAGGTATRAAVVEESGQCLGYGQAGAGNPVSAGPGAALAALVAAAREALAAGTPANVTTVLIAMAGASAQTVTTPIEERFADIGLRGSIAVVSDLLAMFRSGTIATHGHALIAGTGAVAARIEGDRLATVSDGAGWLLGDAGSGYWIGHHVARAVVAALDGRQSETKLTPLLLRATNVEATPERSAGRPLVLHRLMHELYSLRPIELARFAPLAFQARNDPVADDILTTAASKLIATLTSVRDPNPGETPAGQSGVSPGMQAVPDEHPDHGPVVLGGGILSKTILTDTTAFARAMSAGLAGANLIHVRDGVVGAAALGLTRAGITVSDHLLERIDQSVLRRQP